MIIEKIIEAKNNFTKRTNKEPNFIELGIIETKELESFYNKISNWGKNEMQWYKKVEIHSGNKLMGMKVKLSKDITNLTIIYEENY